MINKYGVEEWEELKLPTTDKIKEKSCYNEWFNNQSEKYNTKYFDKYLNLSELQRTAINCLKIDAISFNHYKIISNLINNQLENLSK